MRPWEWIGLGTILFGYFIAIVNLYIKVQVRLTQMESDINHIKQDFHTHEKANEITFTKLERSIEKIDGKLDTIVKILINKNNESSN